MGDRSNQTTLRFWNAIRQHLMSSIVSDHYKSYECIIPKEKHVQTMAQTYTVERYNSLLRHFLARMRRKSKCYSKTREMLQISILLFIHHWNGTLGILK
jgi:insertion element IS1 protein InsB